MFDDSIFALSTARGRAGVAVLRISGPAAATVFTVMASRDPPAPRRAVRLRLADPDSGAALDQALGLWFPAPASFTGEDVTELHLHGGPAVIAAVLACLGDLPGLRPAEAGEFTRRAFEAGKLDLSEVEGLADLIAAETEAQRRQALRQLEGGLSAKAETWREGLIEAAALLEAMIDFSDEDLPDDLEGQLQQKIDVIHGEIAGYLDDGHRGERLRDGLQVAIVGPPNAGKSSLLNALLRRDAAIVTATAGTTRDVIEAHLDLEGFPVTLADTAGIRALDAVQATPDDEIEAEGIRRARARAAAADLVILVLDMADWPPEDPALGDFLTDEDSLLVLNKADLYPAGASPYETADAAAAPGTLSGRLGLVVSAKTGAGLTDLLARLTDIIRRRFAGPVEAPAITRQRHREALETTAAALERIGADIPPELAAEDLRLALRALGRISGRCDVEDILDRIFREFCIGK
ncbi:MAG TPA: tRNA uridine-5-carboxymethylaminomethyl(34) synthesis GTPase MnmE [Kiloniellaceae bacterium]|nr:tRNA uridine-5-carboxymethylaminomethyl(34) synthesis GTPase MnmE [Kiloniellaceae bacterium]